MSAESQAVLAGKRVVLGVTGSIAAYKAPIILRLLHKAGAEVRVILTESARVFVGEQTFLGLGASVHTSMWGQAGELHVELSKWADAVLIAPATADCMARLAAGRSDELLLATALSSSAPLCLAPAMHPSMWQAHATLENAKTLFRRGVHFFGPVSGEVASGDRGVGRLKEPEDIVLNLARVLSGPASLSGRHVVVTAGPTVESLDPVRALSNASSGKMGYAIAAVAHARGARVTLISGPVALSAPSAVDLVRVRSALDMQAALNETLGPNLEHADALVMAAAVADYRPATRSAEKLKRTSQSLTLTLTPNPDILAELGQRRTTLRPVLIGFALETQGGDALVTLGRSKLIDKRVDLIVANEAKDALHRDDNQAFLVSALDCVPLPLMNKVRMASHIVDWLEDRLTGPVAAEQTE